METKPRVAIVVVANNVDRKIIDRFLWSAKNSEKKIPFDIFIGSHSASTEPFRKTTILNDILRKTIDIYPCIVQTDIDMLIPPKLIEITLNKIAEPSVCYHCNYRYVEKDEIEKWYTEGYKSIPWVNISSRKVFCASGSWNGMSNQTWRRSNGFCEAIYNLGGPDTEFFRRCVKRGIKWQQDMIPPLSHINHSRRPICKQGKKNLSIAKRYPLDYNWLFHRQDGVCETTIETSRINQP